MINDPAVAGIALAVLAEMRWAIARLNRRVGELEIGKADKPPSRARRALDRLPSVLLLLGALFLCCGCTGEQVARAEAAAGKAEAVLAQATAAVKVAEAAVAAAQDAAAKGLPGAADALAKSQAALAVTAEALPALQATAAGARQAAEAARQAQEAGASWWAVLAGVVGALVPAAGVIVPAVQRTIAATRAFRQTVSGLDAARDAMGDDRWKATVAPALAAAQDEATRRAVRLTQATA